MELFPSGEKERTMLRIVQRMGELDQVSLAGCLCEDCAAGGECPDDSAERLCLSGRQRDRQSDEVPELHHVARAQFRPAPASA